MQVVNNSFVPKENLFIKSIIPLETETSQVDQNDQAVVGQLFRTRRPDASEVNFAALKQRQITHIINLLATPEENEVLDPNSREISYLSLPKLYEEKGFIHHSFPIKDFETPNKEDLAEMIDGILELLRDGKNIAIHCRSGCGRTGIVVACLAGKVFGLLGSSAILWTRKNIPEAIDTAKQEAFIHKFLKEQVSLDEAYLRVSLMEEGPLFQVVTLMDLAQDALKKGDGARWKEQLLCAKEIAKSIKDPKTGCDSWYRIFCEEIKKDEKAAQSSLVKSWPCAAKIPKLSDKVRAFIKIAGGFETLDLEELRNELLENAEILAEEEQNPNLRATLYLAIARRLSSINPFVAERLLLKAKECLSTVESKLDKVSLLCSIANVFIEVPPISIEEIVENILIAAKDPVPIEELGPLVKKLSNFARWVDKGEGLELLARAVELFEEIEDLSSRDEANYYLRKAQKALNSPIA